MIRTYTIKHLVEQSPEHLILFGLFQDVDNLSQEPHQRNHRGESRYENVDTICKSLFQYVDDIRGCDVAVFPYKFRGLHDPVFRNLLAKCRAHEKVLCLFYNDDFDQTIIPFSRHVRIYRTSLYQSTKQDNEFAFPVFTPDYFDGDYLISPHLSIGFCGHQKNNRNVYLSALAASPLATDLILRSDFWAPEIDRITARREYVENIRRNLFTFCYRGAGNFSYRLYDVLMMGRIPILIDTDCVFPFPAKYCLKDIGVVIGVEDIGSIDVVETVQQYYEEHFLELEAIQQKNRLLWERCFSPCGFLQQLSDELLEVARPSNL